ncbi:hypothetical protein Tco_0939548 [Tanacetum coccineum]|uniref:Uncharacterized protein n=1 Tax=Tanacetum coccineum TaxID=301880 RepID=A0ABQ5DLA0_9ASTR
MMMGGVGDGVGGEGCSVIGTMWCGGLLGEVGREGRGWCDDGVWYWSGPRWERWGVMTSLEWATRRVVGRDSSYKAGGQAETVWVVLGGSGGVQDDMICDYSSFESSLPDNVGHFGTRSCSSNDRTERSDSRETALMQVGNTSSKRQHVCGDHDDQNTSTPRNHPTSTGDCSSTPMDTSGSRVGYTGSLLEYKQVKSCEHYCQHCGARFWYEEHIKDSPKSVRPK